MKLRVGDATLHFSSLVMRLGAPPAEGEPAMLEFIGLTSLGHVRDAWAQIAKNTRGGLHIPALAVDVMVFVDHAELDYKADVGRVTMREIP